MAPELSAQKKTGLGVGNGILGRSHDVNAAGPPDAQAVAWQRFVMSQFGTNG